MVAKHTPGTPLDFPFSHWVLMPQVPPYVLLQLLQPMPAAPPHPNLPHTPTPTPATNPPPAPPRAPAGRPAAPPGSRPHGAAPRPAPAAQPPHSWPAGRAGEVCLRVCIIERSVDMWTRVRSGLGRTGLHTPSRSNSHAMRSIRTRAARAPCRAARHASRTWRKMEVARP